LLAGTLRTTQRHDQQHLHEAIRRMVDSTAASFRAQAKLNIRKGGSMLINEARSSALAAQCASDLFGAEAVIDFPSLMVSENFGDFLDQYPGLMALVGVRNTALGACHAHHHPQFNIDESALHRGVAMHVEFSLRSLAQIA
jgi:amidohydrolase